MDTPKPLLFLNKHRQELNKHRQELNKHRQERRYFGWAETRLGRKESPHVV
jgi:hypothetical protein